MPLGTTYGNADCSSQMSTTQQPNAYNSVPPGQGERSICNFWPRRFAPAKERSGHTARISLVPADRCSRGLEQQVGHDIWHTAAGASADLCCAHTLWDCISKTRAWEKLGNSLRLEAVSSGRDLHRSGREGKGEKDASPNNRFDRHLLAAAQWGETINQTCWFTTYTSECALSPLVLPEHPSPSSLRAQPNFYSMLQMREVLQCLQGKATRTFLLCEKQCIFN